MSMSQIIDKIGWNKTVKWLKSGDWINQSMFFYSNMWWEAFIKEQIEDWNNDIQ